MMVELVAVFSGSFVLALSGALMPGPLLTVTIVESAKRGFIAGPLIIAGHALLELALIVAIIHGLSPYLEKPFVMGGIALVGGAILLWMGLQMVRTANQVSLNDNQKEYKKSSNPVLAGILVSLSNPYWTLWWATIGLGYLVAAIRLGIMGVGVFFVGHIAADLLWYCIVSFGISRGKKILRETIYQNIIRFCGIVLVGFGGWFLITGRSYLGQ
ncbi:MAG: LysE family transporter [Thermodesulfobacteriota bacterium]|nr:LysE family transporter [Thermodesulfobacteriota bacterium]